MKEERDGEKKEGRKKNRRTHRKKEQRKRIRKNEILLLQDYVGVGSSPLPIPPFMSHTDEVPSA